MKTESSISTNLKQSIAVNGEAAVSKADAKKGKHKYTVQSVVRTLAIKCYEDQMPEGWRSVAENITHVDFGFTEKEWQVIAIKHDKDPATDDIWEPSMEKPHYHILMRNIKNKRSRIGALLNMLGVQFRPVIDDLLWDKHGIDTVKNFAGYTMYLLHETPDAIADGKTPYPITDFVSNLSVDEIKAVCDGYARVRVGVKQRYSNEEMAEFDAEAYKLGYDLGDFDEWYGELPFMVRCNTKMRVVKESYERGAHARINEKEGIVRNCIYIQGEPNTGKTYAAMHVFEDKKVLRINGGGTGKYDTIKPSVDVIVMDDETAPNLLNMSDNYRCTCYRRNSNNQYWCGEWFIVTGNLSFEEWVEECGIKTWDHKKRPETRSRHYQALLSRFFVCHIEEREGCRRLVCDSESTRGTLHEQQRRKENFVFFQKEYDRILGKYNPSGEEKESDIQGGGEPAEKTSGEPETVAVAEVESKTEVDAGTGVWGEIDAVGMTTTETMLLLDIAARYTYHPKYFLTYFTMGRMGVREFLEYYGANGGLPPDFFDAGEELQKMFDEG